jgi:Sugar (and other) transporter.
LAPILLVMLRLLQGFGAGAEYGGAVIFAVEYAPEGRRGLFGSWAPIGVTVGNLLAAAVFAIVTLLSKEDLLSGVGASRSCSAPSWSPSDFTFG